MKSSLSIIIPYTLLLFCIVIDYLIIISACKGAAKVLFTGTLTLGCKSYMDAQKQACYCPPEPGWKDKKKSKYTPGGERPEL